MGCLLLREWVDALAAGDGGGSQAGGWGGAAEAGEAACCSAAAQHQVVDFFSGLLRWQLALAVLKLVPRVVERW
jgi:hypothetical protein